VFSIRPPTNSLRPVPNYRVNTLFLVSFLDPVSRYRVYTSNMKSKQKIQTTYTIGQVAKRSGVGIETIRFYEREGVIPKPSRTESGYRQYDEETIKRLHFVGRAKELGFSLKEISQLLSLRLTPRSNCSEVRKKAVAKLEEINKKISDLQRMRSTLKEVTDACEESKPILSCPILNCFDH
jgi:MerR family copper efflux transcriptional regulator